MEDISNIDNREFITPKSLKEAQTAQIFGIASILLTFCTCCNGGPAALILGYIALKKAKKSIEEYEENPNFFTIKSYNQAKSAKTLSLIGICVGFLGLMYLLNGLIFGFAFDIFDLANK
jgi:hypothetical protein